jgi:hypothetical protein
MIITKLMGGLGNQMFQFAAAKSLAVKKKTDVKLDLSFFDVNVTGTHTKRNYELSIFKNFPIASGEDINAFNIWEKNKFLRLANKIFPALQTHRIYREKNFSYDHTFFSWKANTYLIGYWQSEKYFSSIANTVQTEFTFPEYNSLYAGAIKNCSSSVSIHIRRGDYINKPASVNFHHSCSMEYYYKAVNIMASKVANPVFFVFSDDIVWVLQNFKIDFPTHYCSQPSTADYIDMQLMSLCQHNIIANSSFSWWSAWLNANSSKFIIAPSKWFNDDSIDTRDLVPASWTQI